MKGSIKYILTLFTIMLFIVGCKNTNSPEVTASKFILSMRQLDFETAKSLSTKATWNLLNIMEANTQNITDEQKETFGKDFKIKITGTEEENDTTVIVSYVTEPEFVIVPKLRLRSEVDQDGRTRWKVDISSLDDISAEDEEIEERVAPIMEDDSIANIE